ncbi:MAG: hypothetical protein Q4G68_00240 [Planctomycetia bacterium]|nr:hypothetical protein [Planctomycetia bacterium]
MTEKKPTRREVIKKLTLASLGGTIAYSSLEEGHLAKKLMADEYMSAQHQFQEQEVTTKHEVDGVTGATRTSFTLPQRAQLNEKLPMTQIGDVKISRMILGGNLLTGFVHSRDLIYVGDLAQRYNTKQKVYETLLLAEECGMNTFLAYPGVLSMLQDYYKWTGGEIQYICDSRSVKEVNQSIDGGAVGCYPNGEWTDEHVRTEDYDAIIAVLEATRKQGKLAGLGAHRIETCQKLVEKGILPDFWMKTYHHSEYWSRQHSKEYDNVYCRCPDETREFFATRPEPWIAFKVCAAGAIHPSVGIRYAFEGGADFVCVGMYDFQLVDNVNTCVDILKSDLNRARPWQTENIAAEEDA